MSEKTEKEKAKLLKQMPKDFQFLYALAKEKAGIDLWDHLDDLT